MAVDVWFSIYWAYGAVNVLGWLVALISAIFAKPIHPVTLERASMRSLSWISEDPAWFLNAVDVWYAEGEALRERSLRQSSASRKSSA